jgi:2-hydroxychromene-2-carboxylate isomerase
MGELVSLADHRREHQREALDDAARVTLVLAFDLASPFTYLTAERADRLPDDLDWRPVLIPGMGWSADRHARRVAEARAAALRLPLVWPELHASRGRGAMRAAAYAAEEGRGGAFVLAAARLAFCGGFDLDDPDVLIEAAAAANLRLDGCLAAVSDPGRDVAMLEAGRRLVGQGLDRLPGMVVGRRIFSGEDRLVEAVAAARADAWDLRRRALGR